MRRRMCDVMSNREVDIVVFIFILSFSLLLLEKNQKTNIRTVLRTLRPVLLLFNSIYNVLIV